ncbi:hypothetical protein V2J09_007089 [Rumex salicifolius]
MVGHRSFEFCQIEVRRSKESKRRLQVAASARMTRYVDPPDMVSKLHLRRLNASTDLLPHSIFAQQENPFDEPGGSDPGDTWSTTSPLILLPATLAVRLSSHGHSG